MMFQKSILFIAVLLTVAACGHETPKTWNIADPYSIVTPTSDYDAMYRIGFKNYDREDEDVNIHSRSVRHELLDQTMVGYCSDGYDIDHEEFVKEGLLTQTGRAHNYYIYVSCQ